MRASSRGTLALPRLVNDHEMLGVVAKEGLVARVALGQVNACELVSEKMAKSPLSVRTHSTHSLVPEAIRSMSIVYHKFEKTQ